MKTTGVLILLMCCGYLCSAQTVIRGNIRDTRTGEPLSYTTIGVVKSNIYCIGDRDGGFELTLPEDLSPENTVRISLISYEVLEISVADFLKMDSYEICLTPKPFELKEFVLVPEKIKRRSMGTDYYGSNFRIIISPEKIEKRICGVLFKVKRPAILESATVGFHTNTYEEITYRINVYRQTGKYSFEPLNTKPLYASCPHTENPVYITTNLLDQNIEIEGNILVAFELIEVKGDGELSFDSGFFGQTSYYYDLEEDEWKTVIEFDKEDGIDMRFNFKFPLCITLLERKNR